MNANVRYWQSIEREALAELEAAKTNSEVKMAAQQLMRARAKVLELTGKPVAT